MGVGIRPFEAEDEAALRRVMQASLEFDRLPGFTAWELDTELDSIVRVPGRVAVAVEDGTVRGYVGPHQEDLTVHPEFRRRGHGRRLFDAGLAIAANEGWDEIRLHVPSTTAAQGFARAVGLSYRSSMWQFNLAPGTVVPEPAWPKGVVVRTMGDWLDLTRLVSLMNASFAEHPTPISWTVDEIERANSQTGRDDATTLLVSPAERPDELVAFARTAIEFPRADAPAPRAEVRLVGVLPEWRGRGLGRELLRWGVAWLRSSGAGTIQLNVEAENELALGLYRRTGFEPAIEWPHWTRRV
jgi:mycothiol synthase